MKIHKSDICSTLPLNHNAPPPPMHRQCLSSFGQCFFSNECLMVIESSACFFAACAWLTRCELRWVAIFGKISKTTFSSWVNFIFLHWPLYEIISFSHLIFSAFDLIQLWHYGSDESPTVAPSMRVAHGNNVTLGNFVHVNSSLQFTRTYAQFISISPSSGR